MARSDPSKRPRVSLVPADYSDSSTLLVTFGFHCNLACVFCMVEDVLGVYRGADLASFRAFLADDEGMQRIRRVTFSGGEATLEKDLLEYVRLARTAPRVEHVRIQTNATRLANRAYLRELLDAGVDELFVSLHGPDPEVCDRLTAREGSFVEIMAGIEAIAESGATLMTNTAICEPNHTRLADIVKLVAPYGPKTMDFWSLWPRIDPSDERGMFVRVGDVLPHLFAALAECETRGIHPVLKWFPHCLLGEYQRYHDDGQPTVLVEQSYWETAPKFACIYEGVCKHAPDPCAGLSFPYIKRFGWEEDVLHPDLREADDERPAARVIENRSAAPTTALEPWIARIALPEGTELAGWLVRSVRVLHGGVVVSLASGQTELRVRLFPHDPQRRTFARTRTFDVVHDKVASADGPPIAAPLAALLDHIREIDA